LIHATDKADLNLLLSRNETANVNILRRQNAKCPTKRKFTKKLSW